MVRVDWSRTPQSGSSAVPTRWSATGGAAGLSGVARLGDGGGQAPHGSFDLRLRVVRRVETATDQTHAELPYCQCGGQLFDRAMRCANVYSSVRSVVKTVGDHGADTRQRLAGGGSRTRLFVAGIARRGGRRGSAQCNDIIGGARGNCSGLSSARSLFRGLSTGPQRCAGRNARRKPPVRAADRPAEGGDLSPG